MGDLEDALEILEEVSKDSGVPRNIRRAADEASARLKRDDQNLSVKVNAATALLDDVSNDPNMPFQTRTQIMQAAGMLEAAGRKKE